MSINATMNIIDKYQHILPILIYTVLLIFTGKVFLDSYNNLDTIILDGGYITTPIDDTLQLSNDLELNKDYVKKEDLIVWKVQLFQTMFSFIVFIFLFMQLVKPFWNDLPNMFKEYREKKKK